MGGTLNELLKSRSPTQVFDQVVVQGTKNQGVQYCMKVKICNTEIDAVIDTGAQMTIISDRIFDSFLKKPSVLRYIRLKMASRGKSALGIIVGPVKIKIGCKWYNKEVCVAPLEDDMLLGLDILHTQSMLDMIEGKLYFDDQIVDINVTEQGENVAVNIVATERMVIPPNSVVRIKGDMPKVMQDYVIEPLTISNFISPRVLRKGNTDPVFCFINITSNNKIIQKGALIGKAFPVDLTAESSQLPYDPYFVYRVGESTNSSKLETAKVPEHLAETVERSINHLNSPEQEQLVNLLAEYSDVFAATEFDLGHFGDIEHTIDTGEGRPVKQRVRRTPLGFANEEEAHLDKMIKSGVIQESTSEWASAPVLIRKRDGSVRWCIDYRALNDVTVKDVFPLPLVNDCLDTLSGSEWFSKLDANSAYWQIKIKPEDRKKTAFITKYGLFEHVRMGFGLCNAPATYARVMNLVLRGLNWKTVLAFLDDILVLGRDFEEHLENLKDVLIRFRHHGLKLKPKKCIFFQKEVEFLGRMVSRDSIKMSEADIKTVLNWPIPADAKEIERFCGLANYHRTFVKDFSKLAAPLYAVTGKKPNFHWENEQQMAFEKLKTALTSPPVMVLPNETDEFFLDTDASDYAVGAELIQIQGGEEKVVAYGSFTLTKEQRRYCVTRKELLAVVRFTRQFRHYLLGKPFVVRTDHASLTWLLKFKEPQGQIARWLEELSQYPMIVQHREGRKHANADALSRLQPEPGQGCLEDLPCGGCGYCIKVQQQWGEFQVRVDDVVPLTIKSVTVESVQTGLHEELSNETSDGNSQSFSDLGGMSDKITH